MTEKLNRHSVENVNIYLFHSFSLRAECLIVQQQTVDEYAFYCLGKRIS